jgi:hypothetical protein
MKELNVPTASFTPERPALSSTHPLKETKKKTAFLIANDDFL